jgi:hypothetical protein
MLPDASEPCALVELHQHIKLRQAATMPLFQRGGAVLNNLVEIKVSLWMRPSGDTAISTLWTCANRKPAMCINYSSCCKQASDVHACSDAVACSESEGCLVATGSAHKANHTVTVPLH